MTIEVIQKKILSKLMYTPIMKFNQLWNKEGESNKFAYHLKKLENAGLVEKTSNGYRLTTKGKEYVPYIKSRTGTEWKSPLVCIALVVIDDKKNKVLMFQREKEPWHGYCGFHGGKLDSTEYILESAQKSLLEETGLKGQLEFKGIFSSKTYNGKIDSNNNELFLSHQLFVIKASHLKGKVIKKTRKGTNVWVATDNIHKKNIFPNSPLLLKIALSKKFRWIEADRFQENNKFTELRILKDITL